MSWWAISRPRAKRAKRTRARVLQPAPLLRTAENKEQPVSAIPTSLQGPIGCIQRWCQESATGSMLIVSGPCGSGKSTCVRAALVQARVKTVECDASTLTTRAMMKEYLEKEVHETCAFQGEAGMIIRVESAECLSRNVLSVCQSFSCHRVLLVATTPHGRLIDSCIRHNAHVICPKVPDSALRSLLSAFPKHIQDLSIQISAGDARQALICAQWHALLPTVPPRYARTDSTTQPPLRTSLDMDDTCLVDLLSTVFWRDTELITQYTTALTRVQTDRNERVWVSRPLLQRSHG